MFETPVLFLVFNRPDHTRKVFDRIREVKPKYLFVAADGPRASHVEDAEKCRLVREIFIKGIDWDCEVKTLFREENLGCGMGVSTAITWFFENVEEGIILEDDGLPEVFFFWFCSELLKRYSNDDQIMHIGGNNFQSGKQPGVSSYYFSAYSHNWGWATWRTRWIKFNSTISNFNHNSLLLNLRHYSFYKREIEIWIKVFETIRDSKPTDIWDYQWIYTIWKNQGICIVPSVNLVRNIGFDEESTHTKEAHNFLSIPTDSLFMIQHPTERKINFKADRYTFSNYYSVKESLPVKILSILKTLIG